MRTRTLSFIALLAALMLAGACDPDTRLAKDLYDEWFPIHASGHAESDFFTATWDGDLNARGNIFVTYTSKDNPNLSYQDVKNYKALKFEKDRKTFCFVDISTKDYTAGRYLKYYIEDKKIYFEKTNDAGRGSGEYEEGKDITFLDDDTVKIGEVTYIRYSVYYMQSHTGSSEIAGPQMPIMFYL